MRGIFPAFLAIAALLCPPLCGQHDETDVGEVAGFIGGILGVGAHVNGGAGFAVATSRHLVPNVEVSYSSLGTDSFRTGPFDRGTLHVRNSRMYDVNAGFHFRFPAQVDYAPYFGIGLGLLRFSSDLQVAEGVGGQPVVHTANNYFAGNASVGVRYYITQHVGLRPEIKGYFSSQKSFARFAVGLFYQFP